MTATELLRRASKDLRSNIVETYVRLAVEYQVFAFADVSEVRRIADLNSSSVSRRQIMSLSTCRFKGLCGGCNDDVSVCNGLGGRNVLSFSFSYCVPRSGYPLHAPHLIM